VDINELSKESRESHAKKVMAGKNVSLAGVPDSKQTRLYNE